MTVAKKTKAPKFSVGDRVKGSIRARPFIGTVRKVNPKSIIVERDWSFTAATKDKRARTLRVPTSGHDFMMNVTLVLIPKPVGVAFDLDDASRGRR